LKRTLLIILIIIKLFTLEAFALVESAEIRAPQEFYHVGEEITLSFNIHAVENIYGFQIELTYDEDMLLPVQSKVTIDGLLENREFYMASNRVEQGKIRLVGTLLGEGQSIGENGTLFKLNVNTLKEGIVNVHVNTLKFVDIAGTKISIPYSSAHINISRNENTKSSRKNSSTQRTSLAFKVEGHEDDVDNIKVEEVTIHNQEQEGLSIYSKIYEITITQDELKGPITISIPYSGEVDEDTLGIYYYHEGRRKWLYIGGDIDTEKSLITVTVNHLTRFAVFSDKSKETFIDMDKHWSKKYVKRLYLMDFIKGYGDNHFYPNKPITRGEMAVILSRIFKLSSSKDKKFTDESSLPDWARESIFAVSEAGFFNGYGDGSFMPKRNITRAELMNVMGKVLPYQKNNMSFTDMEDIPEWAIKGVETCSYYRIIEGDNQGLIRPQEYITRGEAAAVLYRLLEILKI